MDAEGINMEVFKAAFEKGNIFASSIAVNYGASAIRDKLGKLSEVFSAPHSFLNLYTPKGARYDEVFEVLLIHNAPGQSVNVLDFPEVFRPCDEVDG
ncbi:hypothetical protein V8C34DRAFT_308723 [Trichoderma compactum]